MKYNNNRGKNSLKAISLFQIFLLIGTSFAISFLLSDNFVSAGSWAEPMVFNIIESVAVPPTTMAGAGVGAEPMAYAIFESVAPATGGAPVSIGLSSGVTGPISGVNALLHGTLFQGPGAIGLNGLATAAAYAIVWAAAAYLVGELFGLDARVMDALVPAAAIGGAVHGALLGLQIFGGWASFGIGLGVAAIFFLVTYKKVVTKTATFTCQPFEAPKGGSKCEECNKNPNVPCTKYRCASLGQQCELKNEGTDREACIQVGKNDTLSPRITPWEDALIPQELSYSNYGARPPSLGIKITDGRTASRCIQPFSAFQFGINTNEPAKCVMNYSNTFSEENSGPIRFEEGVYLTYNHTAKMKLPSPNSTEADLSPIVQNDGTFTLFVRCEDAAGNFNVDSYAINFCVDESPDATPPKIEGTSINSGSPIAFGIDETPIEIYTDEPAQCRWSKNNQAYATMETSMVCPGAQDPSQINANLQYTCSSTLKGIENNKENKFYFACNDGLGNVMSTGREFILKGSQKLSILNIKPKNGTTISGGASVVLVNIEAETDDGADSGKAACSYRSLDYSPIQYQLMLNTGGHISKQDNLQLPAGKYTYDIRCADIGGNVIDGSTTFNVFSDKEYPKVTRIYRQEPSSLKILTNEDAQCVYGINSCNYVFADGTAMAYQSVNSKKVHTALWETGKSYYIKCKDDFGNEPNANDCSIIAKTI